MKICLVAFILFLERLSAGQIEFAVVTSDGRFVPYELKSFERMPDLFPPIKSNHRIRGDSVDGVVPGTYKYLLMPSKDAVSKQRGYCEFESIVGHVDFPRNATALGLVEVARCGEIVHRSSTAQSLILPIDIPRNAGWVRIVNLLDRELDRFCSIQGGITVLPRALPPGRYLFVFLSRAGYAGERIGTILEGNKVRFD
jgi:hypothetical protein